MRQVKEEVCLYYIWALAYAPEGFMQIKGCCAGCTSIKHRALKSVKKQGGNGKEGIEGVTDENGKGTYNEAMDDIVNYIDSTVKILQVIKPIYNFKAGE